MGLIVSGLVELCTPHLVHALVVGSSVDVMSVLGLIVTPARHPLSPTVRCADIGNVAFHADIQRVSWAIQKGGKP